MVWDHIRRFLIVWAVIFAVLFIASMVVYGPLIVSSMSSRVGAMVELLMTGVIVVGIVVMLIRGF